MRCSAEHVNCTMERLAEHVIQIITNSGIQSLRKY